MKKTTILTIITMMTVFAITTIAFAWGSKNATGEITAMSDPATMVNVQGYTEGGKLWLGFSFKCGNGEWQDRKPKRVKGRFTETFHLSLCPQGYTQIRACLWKGKSGRFMEGRVHCMDR